MVCHAPLQLASTTFHKLMNSNPIRVEPNIYSILGHALGKHAPGRSSDRTISSEGDSITEPLIVGHHLLLAHASAAKLYMNEYKANQGGQIGLVVNMIWGGMYRVCQGREDATESYECIALF
jgi:hypothetical protein